MALNSVSNRPVPSFSSTPASNVTAPAAAMKPATEDVAVSLKKNVVQPDGFEKRLPLGHGPVVHNPPQEGGFKKDLNQALDTLTHDLEQIQDLLHGDSPQELGPKQLGPVSPRERVNDVAREALGDKLKELNGKLNLREVEPMMAIGGPAAEKYFASQGQKRQVNQGLETLLGDARKGLAQGDTQGLARADKALDAAERIMSLPNDKALDALSDVLGSRMPKGGLKLPSLDKPRLLAPELQGPPLTHLPTQLPTEMPSIKDLVKPMNTLPVLDVPEL
jgi:hypothetical protein